MMTTLAYLDASTGSLLVQMLVGGALTALYVVKTRWASLTAGIRKLGHNGGNSAS